MEPQIIKAGFTELVWDAKHDLGVGEIIKIFFAALREARRGIPKTAHDCITVYGILAVGMTPEDAAAAYCEVKEWGEVEQIVVTDINAERWGVAVGTTDGNFFELGGERVAGGVVASWQR